jgi:Tol biopolymer transport system component
VLFIDKPAADAPAGLWGAALAGGAPELFTDRLGFYSADLQLRVFPQGGQTVVERLADGQQWVISSDGRSVSFSPDGAWVAWTGGQDGPPFDQPVRVVWVSRSDGSEAREVIRLYGGGFSAWFPDGRLLVSGRLDPAEETQAYLAVPLSGEAPVELARGERLRGGLISPQGTWLVYLVTFSENPGENGLWLANTTTGEKRRLEIFGAYRWRDDGRLLVVPLDLTQPVHRLLQVEAASGVAQPLTDPQLEPFKIANGDWSISPDGQKIAFVSAADHNIWLIELPTQ